MRTRREAGRADYSGQSSLLGTRTGRGDRTSSGREGARARPAARVPVRAAGGLGAEPWRRRADRAAQGSAVRRLHAGAVPPLRAAERCRLAHDPEKWEPVFGKDHAQTKRRQLVNGAVIKPRREFAIRLPMINGRKLAAS